MVVLCCIVVVTGFLPSPVSRSSLSSPPSQVYPIHTAAELGDVKLVRLLLAAGADSQQRFLVGFLGKPQK